MNRRIVISILTLFFVGVALLDAGTEREWENNKGKKLTAELTEHNTVNKTVKLRMKNGRSYVLKIDTLCEVDQKWLSDRQDKLATWGSKKNTMETIRFPGQPLMRGRIYCPAEFSVDAPPALIVFLGSGGDGSGMVMQLEKELKAAGVMAIGASGFSKSIKPELRQQRFDLLMNYIEENLPHSDIYLGGFSDGVARCVELAEYRNEVKWKGMLACSGKLDDAQDGSKLPKGLRVVVALGSYDSNANKVASDSLILSKAGCVVSKISFDGGNQLPLGYDMAKVMKKLLMSR